MSGGFGSAIMEFCENMDKPVRVYRIGLPDEFVEHGSRAILLKITGLDAERIAEKVVSFIR